MSGESVSNGGGTKSANLINVISFPTPSINHCPSAYLDGCTCPLNSTTNPFVNSSPSAVV